MKNNEIVKALREHAEWAQSNEWEAPITLRDDLAEAADLIEKLTARYAEELAVAQERPRWIPVTERLPEEGVPVLINYIGTDGKVYADGVAAWTECGWFWGEGGLVYGSEEVAVPITHWMPLPDGPEVE